MNADPRDFFERKDELNESDIELILAYRKQGVPVDWLPYTEHFDAILKDIQSHGDKREAAQVWRRLLNLRKSGRLPPVQLGLTG